MRLFEQKFPNESKSKVVEEATDTSATENVGHMMKSIQEMFEKRITQLETKFESKFDAIVEEKIAATQVVPMYSQTVKESVDVRKIILDQKK